MPILFRWLNREKSNPWIDLFCIVTFNMLVYTVVVSFVTSNPYFTSFSTSYYWSKMKVCLNMIPMFLMGAYMAKYNIIEKILNYLKNGVIIKVFGIVLMWGIFEMRENWLQRSQWGWDQMDFIYAALFVISAACLLYQMDVLKQGLEMLGKHSTGIWFIHSFFCYYYWQKIIYAPKNSIIIFLLLFLVSFVSECILTWGYDLLKKKCRKND